MNKPIEIDAVTRDDLKTVIAEAELNADRTDLTADSLSRKQWYKGIDDDVSALRKKAEYIRDSCKRLRFQIFNI